MTDTQIKNQICSYASHLITLLQESLDPDETIKRYLPSFPCWFEGQIPIIRKIKDRDMPRAQKDALIALLKDYDIPMDAVQKWYYDNVKSLLDKGTAFDAHGEALPLVLYNLLKSKDLVPKGTIKDAAPVSALAACGSCGKTLRKTSSEETNSACPFCAEGKKKAKLLQQQQAATISESKRVPELEELERKSKASQTSSCSSCRMAKYTGQTTAKCGVCGGHGDPKPSKTQPPPLEDIRSQYESDYINEQEEVEGEGIFNNIGNWWKKRGYNNAVQDAEKEIKELYIKNAQIVERYHEKGNDNGYKEDKEWKENTAHINDYKKIIAQGKSNVTDIKKEQLADRVKKPTKSKSKALAEVTSSGTKPRQTSRVPNDTQEGEAFERLRELHTDDPSFKALIKTEPISPSVLRLLEEDQIKRIAAITIMEDLDAQNVRWNKIEDPKKRQIVASLYMIASTH